MRTLLSLALLMLLALSATAQLRPLHYDCLNPSPYEGSPEGASPGSHRSASRLPSIRTEWDSTRVYPVCVVLVSFTDRDFSTDAPQDLYQRIFNEKGYNEGRGPGCVADYFSDQSQGCFHPRFDIYGPIRISTASNKNDNNGGQAVREAVKLLYDSLAVDFAPYDWDDDGRAEHIVAVFAGYGGNEAATEGKGYIWPTTSNFSTLTLGGIRLSGYSASAELWSNDAKCGIGTICHEYSHTLGLPDIYPTRGEEYSVCDEWDLMDGGNFVNSGWCPPSYSAHERMLMGWLTPEELTDTTDITALKPIAEGGNAYLIRSDNPDEFYLLENRQWRGWDLRTPGHGLLIAHVDYTASAWGNNNVNNDPGHHRYDYLHADNLDYNQWAEIIGDANPHVGGHSRILSNTAYPFVTDSVTNDALTDSSTPPATIYSGTGLLGKPITAIREDEEGDISFSFLRDIPADIPALTVPKRPTALYDLSGRRLVTQPRRGIVISTNKTKKQVRP